MPESQVAATEAEENPGWKLEDVRFGGAFELPRGDAVVTARQDQVDLFSWPDWVYPDALDADNDVVIATDVMPVAQFWALIARSRRSVETLEDELASSSDEDILAFAGRLDQVVSDRLRDEPRRSLDSTKFLAHGLVLAGERWSSDESVPLTDGDPVAGEALASVASAALSRRRRRSVQVEGARGGDDVDTDTDVVGKGSWLLNALLNRPRYFAAQWAVAGLLVTGICAAVEDSAALKTLERAAGKSGAKRVVVAGTSLARLSSGDVLISARHS